MADADVSALTKFSITRQGSDYRLDIENDAGDAMHLTATQEQLDIVADTLDDLLDASDPGAAGDAEEDGTGDPDEVTDD